MSRLTFMEPQGEMSWRMVFDLLVMVSVDADRNAVEQWTETELLIAYDWAIREHLHASDNVVRRRARPWFLDARKDDA